MSRRYYAASYGPRYGDPSGTFVSLREGVAEDAAIRGYEFELEELPGYCDVEHDSEFPESDCNLCNPDLCFYGESTYDARDLFSSVSELARYAHELAKGGAVFLER